MITIVQEKCSACGLCVELCHESCLSLQDRRLQLDHEVCSTCAQCVAVCPTQALLWQQNAPVRFDRKQLPSPEQLAELFRERRSIRRFKREKIDRALLEEIVCYGGYAPTHAFSLSAIIVDDDALIAVLDQTIVNTCRWIYRLGYQNPLAPLLASAFGFSDEMAKARPKIEATLAMGHAFHSMPTALVLIVGDKRVPLSVDSAQYALANMMYYAQVKGVGTCLWANGPMFVDKNRKARQALGLASHERIFGAMYMGLPAVRFSNKVDGKGMPMQWNANLHHMA